MSIASLCYSWKEKNIFQTSVDLLNLSSLTFPFVVNCRKISFSCSKLIFVDSRWHLYHCVMVFFCAMMLMVEWRGQGEQPACRTCSGSVPKILLGSGLIRKNSGEVRSIKQTKKDVSLCNCFMRFYEVLKCAVSVRFVVCTEASDWEDLPLDGTWQWHNFPAVSETFLKMCSVSLCCHSSFCSICIQKLQARHEYSSQSHPGRSESENVASRICLLSITVCWFHI